MADRLDKQLMLDKGLVSVSNPTTYNITSVYDTKLQVYRLAPLSVIKFCKQQRVCI